MCGKKTRFRKYLSCFFALLNKLMCWLLKKKGYKYKSEITVWSPKGQTAFGLNVRENVWPWRSEI